MELPRPAPTQVYEEYYSRASAQRVAGVFEVIWRFMRRRKARLIARHAPAGARVCDIGCERGELLNVLKHSGCAVQGTQLSKTAADFAWANFGIDVFVGELPDAPFASEAFDVVLMINVLEHLPRPEQYVAHVSKILRPGASFWIEVPNPGSFTARLFGKRWLHTDPEHHYWGFTRDSLSRLLHHHGFRIERVYHWNWEHAPIGCLQSWMNLLPGPRNVIFGIVREGLSSQARVLAIQLIHAALAGILLPAAFIVSALESLSAEGQVILVRARKLEAQPSPDSAV